MGGEASRAPSLGAHGAGTQHLFRVEVERKGALDPSFRLALRQEATARFELAATDPFGRALWKIEVGERLGRFQEERERWACRFDPAASSAMPRLDWGLTALDLPGVLLGRLPGPAVPEEIAHGVGSFEYRDASGRVWKGETDARGVERWTMASSEGRLAYRREGSGGVLSDDRSGARLKWRELASEPLPDPLAPVPEGTAELPECAGADFS